MWCTSCQCSVSWLEKSHAKNHLSSASRKGAKLNAGKLNKQPGLSALVESPPVAATSTQPPPSTTITEVNDNTRKVVQAQPDLKDVLTGLNHNQHVNDDFVAAFLQAGIAPNKLDHPSLRGLFKKYTSVEGCLGKGATHYRTSERVGKLHIGAIRNRVKAKKV